MGFRVWGLGFRVGGLEFGVLGLGFRIYAGISVFPAIFRSGLLWPLVVLPVPAIFRSALRGMQFRVLGFEGLGFRD